MISLGLVHDRLSDLPVRDMRKVRKMTDGNSCGFIQFVIMITGGRVPINPVGTTVKQREFREQNNTITGRIRQKKKRIKVGFFSITKNL